MEDNYAALGSLTSHQSAQTASANSGQSKWATQEEIHSKETAGADSSKESLLWSKFTVITSPLSSDAVSFFGNRKILSSAKNKTWFSHFFQDWLQWWDGIDTGSVCFGGLIMCIVKVTRGGGMFHVCRAKTTKLN